MRFFYILLIILVAVTAVFARFGGGRGGGGGGRGFSGARASVARGAVSSRSSFSGGVRSGSFGTKVGSSSSPTSYGSSSFRSTAFNSPLYFHPPIIVGHPYVIASGNPPIPYDNRTYHWTAASANQTFSESGKYYIICQYDFGSDDEQLQNVTFANGTQATSLFFGCNQSTSALNCCGMYCCQDTSNPLAEIGGVVFFLLLVLSIVACCSAAFEDSQRNQQQTDQNRRYPVPTEMKRFSNIGPSQKTANPVSQ